MKGFVSEPYAKICPDACAVLGEKTHQKKGKKLLIKKTQKTPPKAKKNLRKDALMVSPLSEIPSHGERQTSQDNIHCSSFCIGHAYKEPLRKEQNL